MKTCVFQAAQIVSGKTGSRGERRKRDCFEKEGSVRRKKRSSRKAQGPPEGSQRGPPDGLPEELPDGLPEGLPEGLPGVPRGLPESSHRALRGPPKSSQRGPQRAPRRLSEGSQRAPGGLPEGSQRPPRGLPKGGRRAAGPGGLPRKKCVFLDKKPRPRGHIRRAPKMRVSRGFPARARIWPARAAEKPKRRGQNNHGDFFRENGPARGFAQKRRFPVSMVIMMQRASERGPPCPPT